MSESIRKWLLWGSLIAILISAGIIFVLSLGSPSDTKIKYIDISTVVITLSVIDIIVYFSLRFHASKLLNIISKISVYLFPFFILVFFLLINFSDYNLLSIMGLIVAIISAVLSIINLFILRELGEIKSIIFLLFSIILSFVLLRISSIQGNLLDVAFGMFAFLTVATGAGMYMYGIRCLVQIEKNVYLKVVSFITCSLIAFASVLTILKTQDMEVGEIEFFYFIPAVILTVIVLFSLPISGIIMWSFQHKKIMKKIMITWVFFFLVFSLSTVFPDLFKKIVFIERQQEQEFWMNDYNIQDKNGL